MKPITLILIKIFFLVLTKSTLVQGPEQRRLLIDENDWVSLSLYLSQRHRPYDGRDQKKKNPELGGANRVTKRIVNSPKYPNKNRPDANLPNARKISNQIGPEISRIRSHEGFSLLGVLWGQLIAHQISFSAASPCTGELVVNIPQDEYVEYYKNLKERGGDLSFARTNFQLDQDGTRQQVSVATPYIDGGVIYGHSKQQGDKLRTFQNGKLKVSADGLLSRIDNGDPDIPNFFVSGDPRFNVNHILTALNSIFYLLHNYYCDQIVQFALQIINSDNDQKNDLDDQDIFQISRTLVASHLQKITYDDWLPLIIGENALSRYISRHASKKKSSYNPNVDPALQNEFSAVAFRFGHSNLWDQLDIFRNVTQEDARQQQKDIDNEIKIPDDHNTVEGAVYKNFGKPGPRFVKEVPLRDIFFNMAKWDDKGMDYLTQVLFGASLTPAKERSLPMNNETRNFLLVDPPFVMAEDLYTRDIMRQRDHGLHGYNVVRQQLGFEPLRDFTDLNDDRDNLLKLKQLYGEQNLNSLDLTLGIFGERRFGLNSQEPYNGQPILGEVGRKILITNFERIRKADRFWYQHILDKKTISQQGKQGRLASIGADDILYMKDLNTGTQQRVDLPTQLNNGQFYSSVAFHPNGSQLFLSSGCKVFCNDLKTGEMKQIHKALGLINHITVSKTGRYISVATKQQKCGVIDLIKERKMKCRPGHDLSIVRGLFSMDQRYITSIGIDKLILVYEIYEDKQPQQVYRNKFSEVDSELNWFVDFHPKNIILATPGCNEVQYIENTKTKWSLKKTGMKHQNPIIMCKFLNDILLATSCSQNFFIWNSTFGIEEKLVVIDDLILTKVIPVYETFFAINNTNPSKDGGIVYQYTKKLQEASQPMDVEPNAEEDVIEFGQEEISKEEIQDQQEDQESQPFEHFVNKKSKADRIITVYPQAPLSTGTSFFDGARFLLINIYGNVIERRGDGQDPRIQVQFVGQADRKITLFRNRDMRYFAMNQCGVAFASDVEFGFWERKYKEKWEKKWLDIQGITIGNSWITVMNAQDVMILDFTGNQLRSFSFDRQFVAMDGYENLLAIAYHQTVPIWGNQSLSMQIFTVDCHKQSKSNKFTVPIKPESVLRWFGFSQQGMLITQDSIGGIRVFNLATRIWSCVQVTQLPVNRRVWIVGMANYQIKYWKTTQLEPEPTVSPRLNQKSNTLIIGSLQNQENDQQTKLLWKRFCLDHQKARNQLWGRYRARRQESHPFYDISKTVMNESQNQQAHQKLDYQYIGIIRTLLNEKHHQKALNLSKNVIRTVKVGRQIVDIVDRQYRLRHSSIQLERHCDQMQKEIEYQAVETFRFDRLKVEMQKTIQPKNQDPMKRKPKGQRLENFSTGFTQMTTNSLASSRVQQYHENNAPKKSLEINQQKNISATQIDNPYLKKKGTVNLQMERQKKQIEDQLAKKKAEEEKNPLKIKRISKNL